MDARDRPFAVALHSLKKHIEAFVDDAMVQAISGVAQHPPPPNVEIGFQATLGGSLESFDAAAQLAYRAGIASVAEVPVAQVTIDSVAAGTAKLPHRGGAPCWVASGKLSAASALLFL